MSRRIHRLTVRQIAAAKLPEGKDHVMLPDGGNLYLQLTSGTGGEALNRSWIFRYQLDGRRRDLGLGPYHDRSLAEAREKARAFRQQLLDGIDPNAERQQRNAERVAQQVERAKRITFRECAQRCIGAHSNNWRNAEHGRQWRTSLEQYAYPIIGDLPVAEIDVALVVKVLDPIWYDINETAHRVRGRIEKVLGWATVRGFRSGDNPARWRGHLAELFPANIAAVKHHAALPYAELPIFMAKLRERDHLVARALEFTILTAARTGETLGATWNEIDLATKTWTVLASRMKGGKEHKVPLSNRAIEVLQALPHREGRIFQIGTKAAMLFVLREIHGGRGPTIHGFRSSFRDWCSERTSYPEAVCEQALAHAIGSKVERAYNRSDLFEKRRRLMDEWAKFCSRPAPAGATVVALKA